MKEGPYVHNKHPRKIFAWWMMGVCLSVAKHPRHLSLVHLLVELPVESLLNYLKDPTHRNGVAQVILASLVVHHPSAVYPQALKVPTVSGVLWNAAKLHGSCHMHDHPLDMRKRVQTCMHPQENTCRIGNACKVDASHP